MTYEIGILGAGNVGTTLGIKWAQKGHKITFGVRTPEKYTSLKEKSKNISITTAIELVKTHKLLVLALPGKEIGSISTSFGDLAGKFIIDATNMYGMQKLVEQFPKAHFVKAFNHIGYNIMDQPHIADENVTLLFCGNNDELLNITSTLASDLGFDTFYIGDSSFAVDLENFAMLWIKISRKIGRNFGFKLLK